MRTTIILCVVTWSLIMSFLVYNKVEAQEQAVPLPCVVIDKDISIDELEQRINYWKYERNYNFQVVNQPRHWEYLIVATCKDDTK